jgi:hypothetical protein
MTDRQLPPPDKLLSLAEAARVLGVDASRLRRRANLGLLDTDLVGRTHVTTLRRLVASWDRRGDRGPAPSPLPPEVILHVRER